MRSCGLNSPSGLPEPTSTNAPDGDRDAFALNYVPTIRGYVEKDVDEMVLDD
jgi:hypothetical protein